MNASSASASSSAPSLGAASADSSAAPARPTRALVLAGGGAAGNAWQLGLIAGTFWG